MKRLESEAAEDNKRGSVWKNLRLHKSQGFIKVRWITS
jgi:hypothetical protein